MFRSCIWRYIATQRIIGFWSIQCPSLRKPSLPGTSGHSCVLSSMGKRKNHSSLAQEPTSTRILTIKPLLDDGPPSKRRASQRKISQPNRMPLSTNPNKNANILDSAEALRASPDADEQDERMGVERAGMDAISQIRHDEEALSLINGNDSESPLTDISDSESSMLDVEPKRRSGTSTSTKVKANTKSKEKQVLAKKSKVETEKTQFLNPEADEDEEADEEEIQAALSRPPPVNSDYLPLPWKGRLGYACLCTYLRFSNPPVFSSRTCRIASILENRHPLRDPNEAPHATKNRPDKDQPANIERGQAFVESLGLANARDIVKMLRWNERYGIRFLRLSSEMFPFASHEEYGYKLAPFASETLAEAGRVATELGHRLTTHPGQFTQLGSPRKQVITSAIRDLEYHAELLSLLKLPPPQDRDAVMILHLGGVFGDKAATLDRFRENYRGLSQEIKNRLVLENDDVSWSVHDLLPLCEELNIPMVLDYHHHNIMFDADQIREGTKDIMQLYPRILATWARKNITPKMHYSEPTPSAITKRQRSKHSPRVATLPPCPPTMDLMIEAKDKEQAVFELMRTFKLPGHDTFNDIIPHVRKDDNKATKPAKPKTPRKKPKGPNPEEIEQDQSQKPAEPFTPSVIADDDVGMGGPEGRVYWPPGMEHWLRPVKKVIKPKPSPDSAEVAMPENKKKMPRAIADTPQQAVKLEDQHLDEDTASIASEMVVPMSAKKKAKAKTESLKKATAHRQKSANPPTSSNKEEVDEVGNDEEGAEEAVPRRKSKRAKKT